MAKKKSIFGNKVIKGAEVQKVSEKDYLDELFNNELEAKKEIIVIEETTKQLTSPKQQATPEKIVKSMSLYVDSIDTFRDVVETYKKHEDFRMSFADVFRALVENEKNRLEELYGELEKAPEPKVGRR